MNTFKGFDKRQTKKLIMKTMDDVKQFQKYSEEDQKKIKGLKLENSKLIQKIETFANENKALKKPGKMPSEDEMAREVAKRKLMLAAKEKKPNKGQSFQSEMNCYKKNVYKEESRDKEVEENSDVEEYIKKKKQRKCPKKSKKEESRCDDEESSADEKPNKKSNYLPQKQFKVLEYISKLRIAFQCLLLPVILPHVNFRALKQLI